MTKNMAVGESVYGEKRIAVEDEAGKIEYRVWNPFRSKLAAAVLGGVDKIHMPPGSKVCSFLTPLIQMKPKCSGLVSWSCQWNLS